MYHGLIPLSGASRNALNRVFVPIIVGVSKTPLFLFYQIYWKNVTFQCKKKGLFTHIVI